MASKSGPSYALADANEYAVFDRFCLRGIRTDSRYLPSRAVRKISFRGPLFGALERSMKRGGPSERMAGDEAETFEAF